MTDAILSEPMLAVAAESVAERSLAGAVNVKMPPATGSTGLLAATLTARGFANAVPVAVDCGVLPGMGVSVKPWLWKAPMSGLGESSGSPRWSLVTPVTAMPAPKAGLPGSRAMVWVGPP